MSNAPNDQLTDGGPSVTPELPPGEEDQQADPRSCVDRKNDRTPLMNLTETQIDLPPTCKSQKSSQSLSSPTAPFSGFMTKLCLRNSSMCIDAVFSGKRISSPMAAPRCLPNCQLASRVRHSVKRLVRHFGVSPLLGPSAGSARRIRSTQRH